MKFLHEFLEYQNGKKVDNGWWLIDEKLNRLYNRRSGYHSYEPSGNDIIVEADNWQDLDWSCLLKPDSPYGWIDLNGTFYGCDHFEHAELADLYFKSNERALEDIGYIKVYREIDGTVAYYTSRRFPTEKQEQTLIDRGIEL